MVLSTMVPGLGSRLKDYPFTHRIYSRETKDYLFYTEYYSLNAPSLLPRPGVEPRRPRRPRPSTISILKVAGLNPIGRPHGSRPERDGLDSDVPLDGPHPFGAHGLEPSPGGLHRLGLKQFRLDQNIDQPHGLPPRLRGRSPGGPDDQDRPGRLRTSTSLPPSGRGCLTVSSFLLLLSLLPSRIRRASNIYTLTLECPNDGRTNRPTQSRSPFAC